MNSMMSMAILNELFDYNYWARDRQLQACAGLTQEQFLRPLGNSFPSLRDTLTHLLAVEWLWLERWRGQSPRILLAPEEFPTLAALSLRWRTVQHEMREYLAGLNEAALERPLTVVSTRGQEWTYPLGRMIPQGDPIPRPMLRCPVGQAVPPGGIGAVLLWANPKSSAPYGLALLNDRRKR
jgi:uncharacterized damage-inducible protein DinB